MQYQGQQFSIITLVLGAALGGCALPQAPQTRLSQQLQQIATRHTITVAHRGDSASHPENTVPAFTSAVVLGAEMVELDFRQTADGKLVCMHDATLDRTTDSRSRWQQQKLNLASQAWQRLQELDAGSWKHARFRGTRIPSLESALRSIQPGSITMIEHKAGTAARLVALLRRLDLVESVLVQSFQWQFLEQVHALEPRLALAALGGSKQQPSPVAAGVLQRLAATGSCMVHWSFRHLRAEDVRELHRRGYLVCVYTVDKPEDFAAAIAMGVDAITTNRPGRLRSIVSKAAAAASPGH